MVKNKQSEVPKKHHLIIYSDDESMMRMLKSMDRLAKEDNLSFGPPHSPSTELLTKLKWYDGTVKPYYYYSTQKSNGIQQLQVQSQKNIMKYCDKVIQNVVNNASNKQVCCLDFLMNDVKKSSLKEVLHIEKVYDDNRIAGLMYCAYKTDNVLNSKIKDLIELFEMHDQIFILNEDEVYKLHITKENVHKLFLS